jgi:ABC-type polysaccharide/polyol phosphate export permease
LAARPASPFAELWQYRELMRQLIVRNLKVRYQRSVLGFVWTLLNPLLTMLVLVAVFAYVIRIGVPHYWAFLLSGYFAWVFTMHTLNASAFVITDHAYLARSVAVPSDLLVVSGVFSRLVEYAAELGLVAAALIVFHHHAIPPSFLLLPVILLLHVLLIVGISMPIASLSVFFSDVQHGLPVALMMVAYISPVFYPVSYVPASVRTLYLLNPLALLLALYHDVLYEGRMPDPTMFAAVALLAVVACVAGYAWFRRSRALFAEII